MRRKLLALAAWVVLVLTANATLAQRATVDIRDVWARATPGGAQTAAAYATIEAADGDRLIGVSTPAAQTAELHTMTMDNGVMKMREIDGLDIPPGKPVTLKPGGYHIMLSGLAKPLETGQTFPLTLTFAKSGAQQLTVSVQKVGAMGPDGGMGGMQHMHGTDMPAHR